jgi:peptidoglycan/xylan/chitin deacetylase (PgdA/CDA1 family)
MGMIQLKSSFLHHQPPSRVIVSFFLLIALCGGSKTETLATVFSDQMMPNPPASSHLELPLPATPESLYRVAVTFDDGPGAAEIQTRLLEVLDRYNARCTFFLIGKNVELRPMEVRQIVEAGHTIGNHSYSHPNFLRLSNAKQYFEVTETQRLIFETAGVTPTLFRPPYGSFYDDTGNSGSLQVIRWNVDSRDWALKNTQKIVDFTLPQIHDLSIILFHSIYETTVDAVEIILDTLSNQGYSFVTAEEILELST